MARSRQRALSLLERLARQEMEGEARRLAALRAEAAEKRRGGAALVARMQEETQDLHLETAAYLPGYMRAVRAEVAALEAAATRAEAEAEGLEDGVREGFRQVKTYEMARLSAQRAEAQERARKEDAEAEELALIRWTRAAG
ncbi:hypothetical protein [Pseudoroseicyclus aestuarii]|uniref:Flagellar FliJ protein n=1 Tax=Pseudoroseicyclus aestuarii TaxID=1795041 RepID=A0A318T7I4_9RHOB|nr:hypothetical protein [Pseudoroseicyclus aestuarii]PYE84358.1 hypothetical protein DFP88_102156 [Pseudoroseicyclus aestuarii]